MTNDSPINMSHSPIRWTLLAAQKEYGPHRDTIKAKLVQTGQKPAADGTYSTQQISAALFTEEYRERIRKIREEADKLELANQETRAQLISVEEATAIAQRFASALRGIVLKTKLSPEEKASCLEEAKALAGVDFSNLDQYFDEEGQS